METETQYPFTRQQLDGLNNEQKQAIDAVAEFLTGSTISQETNLSDESISEALNLLKPSDGCVPPEEADEDLLRTIRKKFAAVYQVGMELAEQELNHKGIKEFDQFNFCIVIEPDSEDCTHVVILDYKRPVCHLHEWSKAWNFHFSTLALLADEVLRIQKHLAQAVANITKPRELMIVLEGGLVREVVDLPENTNVTIIDYDVEDADPQDLKISPLDGDPCYITKL